MVRKINIKEPIIILKISYRKKKPSIELIKVGGITNGIWLGFQIIRSYLIWLKDCYT